MVHNPRQPNSSPGLPVVFGQRGKWWCCPKVWGFCCGGGAAIAVGIGYYGHVWVYNDVAPLVEQGIRHFLNRPIELGKLTSVSLTHLEFGPTQIPSTPQDPNWVNLQGLRVSYNPLQYLWEHHLGLTITAIRPQAHFEQGKSGAWLHTNMNRMNADFPLRLNALVIEEAEGSLVTRHFATQRLNAPVKLRLKSARFAPHAADQTLRFQLDGQLLPSVATRSRLSLEGKFDGRQKSLIINVKTHQLPAAPLRELLPLPLDIRGGTLNGQLAIAVEHETLTALDGQIDIHEGTLKLPPLARPLTHINGPLIFQGRHIYFGKINAHLDRLQAQGNGYLDWREGFQLAIATQPLGVNQIFQSLNFPRPTIPLSGQLASTIQIQGKLDNPAVQVKLRQAGPQPVRIEQLALRDFSADLTISDHRVGIHHLRAVSQGGGPITGSGEVKSRVKNGQTLWQPFKLRLNAQSLDASPWVPTQFKPQLPKVLPLSGQVVIQGELNKPDRWQAQAQVALPLYGGSIHSQNFTYQGRQWQGDFHLSQIPVQALNQGQSQALPSVIQAGRMSGQVRVQGQQDRLLELTANGQGTVAIPKGTLTIPQFQLRQGQWQATMQGANLPAQGFIPATGANPGQISGQMVAQGRLDRPLTEIKTTGQGEWQVGQGRIRLKQFQWDRGQWQGEFAAQAFPVQALPMTVAQQHAGLIDGRLAARGKMHQSPQNWQWFGAGQWRSPSGVMTASEISLENQRFTARLSSPGLDWQALHFSQPGQVRGHLQLAGQWQDQTFQLRQIQGNVTSESGWQRLQTPVQVAFDWQGNGLKLDRLSSQRLSAQGEITVPIAAVKPGFNFTQNIQGLNLQVQARQFSVSQLLPFDQMGVNPATVPLGGKLDFSGQVTGTGQHPNVQGQVAIADLRLGDYRFAPRLTGSLQNNAQGSQLALQGSDERLRFSLDGRHQPTAMLWERSATKLEGMRRDGQWFLSAQKLPLTALQASLPTAIALAPNLPPQVRSIFDQVQRQSLAGELSGNFQLDLAQQTAIGTRVNIQEPRWGNFRGNDVTANFSLNRGQFTLESARLRYGKSIFLMQGQGDFRGARPQWGGTLSFRDSRIEDLLETFHLFAWQDLERGLQPPVYAKAKDLYDANQDPQQPLASVGDGGVNLYQQLNQLSASKAQLNRPQSQPTPLPELSELQGQFQGKITAQSNGQDPIAAQFHLQGQNWQWGDYQLAQLTLAGRWQGENISLDPLELRSGDRFLRLSGELGPKTQQGQLQIHHVPLAPLVKAFNLPDYLRPDGNIFADFQLGGSRRDPEFQGVVHIQDPRLPSVALQTATGNFHYQTGRLDFQLQSAINRQTEPLILAGSIPYVFPFAQQLPASDQFSVALRLKNDGLSLINLATNQQLTWLNGEGAMDLRLFGRLDPQNQTLYQLQGQGEAIIKNATIAAQVLPNTPLTQVNGRILADLNAIQVEHLTGNISGGNLAIRGTLPVKNPLPVADQNLQLSLNNLAVNIPTIYQGALAGNVAINGTAIAPQIGGQLDLFKGNILLGKSFAALAPPPDNASSNGGLQFQGLTLNLRDNIRIQNLPFLDFAAIGSLRLFGPLDRLQPEGQIELKGGQINLFASQLRLDGSQANTVQFLPERGLDPYLDLHFASAASETNRNNRLPRNPLSSEIDEPFSATQESLQTVRIRAQITGQASELGQNIQLTSTPRRSEQEIITLLGGGFINTLGQDNTQTTVGLANLAGSAVLGTVQGQIGEALGLSEFRIFSTPLVNAEDRLQGNQIGVAAEAGIDLTQQLGVSIQKVINSDRPPQWGLRYRINDNTVIRGSSNFDDDSRGVIEFQQRF